MIQYNKKHCEYVQFIFQASDDIMLSETCYGEVSFINWNGTKIS